MRRALLIAGPTASGKSAAALKLAERLGALIVNADSMQVYADLRILTARPTPDEERAAPHRLFGEIDGAVNYSVGRWVRAARDVLAEVGEAAGHFCRRHGPLFPRADRRPVGSARRARSLARRRAAQGGGARDGGAPCRARGARSRNRGARDDGRPPADLARARSVGRDRAPLASFLGARAAPALAAGRMDRPVPRSRSGGALRGASTRGSMRCSTRARSTRSRA